VKLVIYVNSHYEEERALVDLEREGIILKGDYYHDKINYLIDGYLLALREHEIYPEEVDTIEITKDHPFYLSLDFYCEDCDE
jgi:hypothetical protein